VIPGQYFAVEDRVIWRGSCSGYRATDLDRLLQGQRTLLEGMGIVPTDQDTFGSHFVVVLRIILVQVGIVLPSGRTGILYPPTAAGYNHSRRGE